MIFDEVTIRKLNQLTLVARKVRSGAIKGERRSTRHGTSIEFADYRDYVPGDDLRRLDWNVYARLEKPFVKLLEEEEDLAVHVLLDASASMKSALPEEGGQGEKFGYALRLAAALGAIALGAGDYLSVACLRGEGSQAQYGPGRGTQHLVRLLAFLESQKAEGSTDLGRSIHEYLTAPRRPGLAFLISDLFSPTGYQAGLWELQGGGFEVNVLHLLTPDEVDPPLAGDLRLIDVETGQGQEVSLDGGMRALYRKRLQDWRDEIEAACLRRNVRYIPVSTAQPWDELVLLGLRKAGVVR